MEIHSMATHKVPCVSQPGSPEPSLILRADGTVCTVEVELCAQSTIPHIDLRISPLIFAAPPGTPMWKYLLITAEHLGCCGVYFGSAINM